MSETFSFFDPGARRDPAVERPLALLLLAAVLVGHGLGRAVPGVSALTDGAQGLGAVASALALAQAVLACVAALALWRRARRALAWTAALAAALVAELAVESFGLGVRSPSRVAAGAVLGAALVAVAAAVLGRRG